MPATGSRRTEGERPVAAIDVMRARSIRFRLTAIATAVVAVVLAVTSIVLLDVQRRQLTANLDASLVRRADELTATLATAPDTAQFTAGDEDRAVQLVAPDGRVLASSANLGDADPIAPRPAGDTQVIRTRRDVPLDDDAYRVLSRVIDTPDGPAVLHVVENGDDIEDAMRDLTAALALGLPAVVAALATVMWWLTGRTLRPVDRIRAQVDSISGAPSDQRVDVPDRDDEISRLAATMNRMLDRLADSAERQRRFVADAAHELRTPLTRIRTNVDVDLAHPDRADPTATNAAIRDEAIGLQELIDDLLHLARSDADEMDRRHEPVDLDDIVIEEIGELRAAHPSLTVDATAVSAAHVRGDAGQLRRAVRNVLGNAARHAGSTVGVALTEHHGVVDLAIADDGPGVPVGDRERIFERFARVEDARSRSGGGSGLGLAIARDIVTAHGGSIVYDDAHHGGARFVIRIPTADAGPA